VYPNAGESSDVYIYIYIYAYTISLCIYTRVYSIHYMFMYVHVCITGAGQESGPNVDERHEAVGPNVGESSNVYIYIYMYVYMIYLYIYMCVLQGQSWSRVQR